MEEHAQQEVVKANQRCEERIAFMEEVVEKVKAQKEHEVERTEKQAATDVAFMEERVARMQKEWTSDIDTSKKASKAETDAEWTERLNQKQTEVERMKIIISRQDQEAQDQLVKVTDHLSKTIDEHKEFKSVTVKELEDNFNSELQEVIQTYEAHVKTVQEQKSEVHSKLAPLEEIYSLRCQELAVFEQRNKDKAEHIVQMEQDARESATKLKEAYRNLKQAENNLEARTADNGMFDAQNDEMRQKLEEYELNTVQLNAQFEAQLEGLSDQHQDLLDEQQKTLREVDEMYQKQMKETDKAHTEQMRVTSKETTNAQKLYEHGQARVRDLEEAVIKMDDNSEHLQSMRIKYSEMQEEYIKMQEMKHELEERIQEQEAALEVWYCRKCYLTMDAEEH